MGLFVRLAHFLQSTRNRQYQSKSVLGDSVFVDAGNVAHRDAATRAFSPIDVIVARRTRRDELHAGMRLEKSFVHTRMNKNRNRFRVSLDVFEFVDASQGKSARFSRKKSDSETCVSTR